MVGVKTVEITIPDELAAKVEQAAQRRGVPVEELVRTSVVEKLERDAELEAAVEHVLAKNAELYERLA